MSRSHNSTEIFTSDRPRETTGWRAGRPVEDPEKTKRWGFVSARPSEFLVHVRRGAVRTSSSGQGATCFKWPWDSVAVIPTSLQQLRFRADQVTLERVGVEVTGLAVYRIADPLVAYRVLNFSFPERAQQKLEETLSAMFVGAARRLIANLAVDDCLQKRKEALADELLREVAPVVGGSGAPDEDNPRGWGIVVDTIEIQEVRVLSEAVFRQMQAPFRSGLDRRARIARAEAEKEVTARETACAKDIEEARIAQTLAVAEKKTGLALRQAEIARDEELKKTALAREVEAARLVDDAALRERKASLLLQERQAEIQRAMVLEQLRRQEAEARLATHALLLDAAQKEAELKALLREQQLAEQRAAAEMIRVKGSADLEIAQKNAEVQALVAASDARVALAKNLPALAGAVGQKFGEVKVTTIGGEGQNPFGQVAQAVAAVVELVKAA
jgi:flotillin